MRWAFPDYVTKAAIQQRFDPMELLGLLPTMLSEHNPKSAVEQLDDGYQHGGGWNESNQNWSLNQFENELLWNGGEETNRLIGWTALREEKIMLFEHSWVCVLQPNGTINVARMD